MNLPQNKLLTAVELF